MKSYTDLGQSRKLSEILSLDSADMEYMFLKKDNSLVSKVPFVKDGLEEPDCPYNMVPCWSLAALLDALRVFTMPTAFSVKVSTPSLIKTENGYKLIYTGDYTQMINNELNIEPPIESVADNPVDACYEIILKYHELNIL